MMMDLSDQDILRLNELINAVIDNAITEEMAAELQQRLASSEDVRRYYARWMALSAALHHEACIMQSEPLDASAAEESNSTKLAEPATGISRRSTYGLVAAVCTLAACLLVVAFLWRLWQPPHAGTRVGREIDRPPAIAEVTQLVRAQWPDNANALVLGQHLKQEWTHLTSGIVQIECSSGALLSIEGPAELRLDSDMECFLRTGKMVVLVPEGVVGFKVESPHSEVIDLGTEFGVVVTELGQMEVHVLAGEVEVAVREKGVPKKKLTAGNGVSVHPRQQRIESIPFDSKTFGTLRPQVSGEKRPLRIQFDCGVGAGVYEGIESPAHAAGDLLPHENTWNLIIGDHKGDFVAADGATVPFELEVDYGRQMHPRRSVDWRGNEVPRSNSKFPSNGVFRSALGQDDVSSDGTVGLRFRGLPAGRYRVYFLGREARAYPSNYLTKWAFRAAVGVNIDQLPEKPLAISPLDDPQAKAWVKGQTHVVDEVTIHSPDEYLTVLTCIDRTRSASRGGRGAIVGVQIVQVNE
jgi:hypothetical protein